MQANEGGLQVKDLAHELPYMANSHVPLHVAKTDPSREGKGHAEEIKRRPIPVFQLGVGSLAFTGGVSIFGRYERQQRRRHRSS